MPSGCVIRHALRSRQLRLDAVAETSYASCGDLSLAYQVFGDGPVELVWAGSFASHVELYWAMPEFGSLMEKLGTFARILLFDKAGVGLSDPVSSHPRQTSSRDRGRHGRRRLRQGRPSRCE